MGTIITCGVYGFTEEAFEKAIVDSRPDVFIDARHRRGLRGSEYTFANSSRLQEILTDHDITYVHRKDLPPSEEVIKREGEIDKDRGIARHDRDSLSEEFIASYKREVLDDFDAREFIESLGGAERVLIFCVEKTPAACHRGLLAAEVAKQLGWDRQDIVPD